jgi:hypothetical protein
MWTSLGPLQEFVNLNQLDGIGTTVRNFKNPRNWHVDIVVRYYPFISLSVS